MRARIESSRPRRRLLALLVTMGLTLPAHAQTNPPPTADKPARTDHFGDPLPPGAIARLGTVRLRHGGRLQAVHFSSDGRTLFSASRDRQDISIQAWDVSTGRGRWEAALRGTYGGIGVSPNGKMLAVGRFGEALNFWMPPREKRYNRWEKSGLPTQIRPSRPTVA